VLAKLSTGDVDLHGWVYNIEHGSIVAYDTESDSFVAAEKHYEELIEASADSVETAQN
jgi:carbonic anhydrase